MLKNIAFLLLLLFATTGFSQNTSDKTIYLDSLGNEVSKESHSFYRVIKDYEKEIPTYFIQEFYKSGAIKNSGNSTRKEYIIKTGEWLHFYENGNKKTSISYGEKSKPVGKETNWYENGSLKSEEEYIENPPKPDFQKKMLNFWDKNKKQTVKDGNGYCSNQNDEETSEGTFKNGYKDGEWKGKILKTTYKYFDTYQEGVFVSGYTINGDNARTDYTLLEKQPRPKSGYEDFYAFVGENFTYSDEAFKKNIKGKVLIGFIVDKEGNLTDFRVHKSLHPDLDQEAINVIWRYGKWLPGERRGRRVRYSFALPLALQGR
ncbi:TonB family protein [Flavobacterium pedocola]